MLDPHMAHEWMNESVYLPILCSNYTIGDIKVNMHAIIIIFFLLLRDESKTNEKKDAIVAWKIHRNP